MRTVSWCLVLPWGGQVEPETCLACFQLRMNIVTAIIILDSEPSTDGAVGKQAVLTLQEMLKANESSLPIRYGIVLTNSQPSDVMEWGRASAYERACRAC